MASRAGDAEAAHLAAQVSEYKLLIQQHIQKQGQLKGVRSVKMLFCGPPKTGKTTTMLRLTNCLRCIDPNGLPNTVQLPSTVLGKPHTIQLRHLLIGDDKIWNFEESVKKLGQSLYSLILDPTHTTGATPTITDATPTISDDRADSGAKQATTAVQDIDLEEVTRLAEAAEWVEVKNKLIEFEHITILYVIDSGGQPECQEILPLLLDGHILSLIFLNLTKKLGDKHPVLFRTGKSTAYDEKPLSDFTTGEVIQRILTSVSSLQSARHNSLAVFVGTYFDKATKHQVLDLDRAVQSTFRVFIDENIVCPVGVEGDLIKYIETLDNTSSDQRDIERLRTLILRIINEQFRHDQEYGVPTGWMLLHLILRDKYQEKGWCTMAECIATAASCGITENELPLVLKYTHKNYGTILYYPDVLKDIVICDPDVILSPLKSVFEFVSSCEFVTQITVTKRIRNTGEISQHDLEFCFKKDGVSLPTPDVIELFKHCHILCETGCSKEFFMPCLLRTDNSIIEEANDPQSLASLYPAPILFVPSSKFQRNCATPLGVFSALVVEMSADGKWKSKVCFKNRISFDVVDRTSGRKHTVELRLYATYIELRHIHGPIDTKMLVAFHRKLYNALDRISHQFSHTKAINWQWGFYCPGGLKEGGRSHFALVERNIPAVEMTCNFEPPCCKRVTDLEDKHKIWFEEEPGGREKEPTVSTGNSSSFLSTTPTILELKKMRGANGEPLKVVERIAAGDFMTFGMYLLQDDNGDEVEVITNNHKQGGAESVTEAILKRWLTSGAPTHTYDHLMKCLRYSDLGALADNIATDFVVKGYLREVEVFGEIVLEVVGDKPQKLEWPGYGFYIEVPEGALSPGVTAIVAVKVLLGSQFEIPEDSQLISAIYWISSSEVFLKEVAVNIQHCAIITSVKQLSELKFIVARCSQEVLPYKFKEKDGLFNTHTQYAAIKVKQFSIFGIKGSKNTELRCVSLKFYKPIPYTKRVDYDFILVRDLDSCVKAVRHKYKIFEFKEETQTQAISFVSSEVELDLPFFSPKTVNGWKIQPLTHPQLAKTEVQQFQPSKQVPACSIELEWTGEGRQQELFHKVTIKGAKEPNNVFVMRYYPETTSNETMVVPQQPNSTVALEYPPPTAAAATAASSTNSEIAATQQSTDSHQEQVSENPLDKPLDTLQLLNKVASKSKDKWRLVGIGLGIEEDQLDVISDEKDPILRYSKVFSQWKRKADPKFLFNWRTILNVLRSPIIEENSLAKEIEEWLTTCQ